MDKGIKVFKLLHSRVWLQPLGASYKNSIVVLPTRLCSNDKKSLKNMDDNEALPPSVSPHLPDVLIWNESWAIKKLKKSKLSKIFTKDENLTDLVRNLQNINNFPSTLTDLYYYLQRKQVNKQVIEQTYLPERQRVLKPDLAAAHFLLRRGASIRFLGKTNWVGGKTGKVAIPSIYVPGIYIEAINAEGTGLMFEGLENLSSLRFLTTLSLKGLKDINNWCLDWISYEYSSHLEHLDISDCKAVTHKGLSCFYRFQCLKTLNVKGISESPEFKLACLMLQDVFPHLEINGIDLSIPKKIDAVSLNDTNVPTT